MRLSRISSAVTATILFAAASAGAQNAGAFRDSWFWGAKAGINTFSTGPNGTASAPTWGLDWLITRDRGGLYVSADEAFFNRTVTSADATSANGTRDVRISNLKRISFALMAFPNKIGVFNPYGGAGAAISLLGRATAGADSLGGAPGQPFLDATEKARSRASLLVMAGVQTQSPRLAFFVQETILPGGKDFLVRNAMSFLEVGVRHSFGSPSEGSR